MLSYNLQITYLKKKVHILWKSNIVQHFRILYYMVLVLLSPNKSVYSVCCYAYWWLRD
jgi:hypothetical protein